MHRSKLCLAALATCALLGAATCSSVPRAAHPGAGRAFPDADPLFHRDPRWLGADAALSVPLGAGRILWMFGDTFVATSDAHVRTESKMVRNSIAIQTGADPRTAAISFHWRRDPDGSPASFFPERGDRWYWPGQGVRLAEGPLVVFLFRLIATPGRGLGFASDGFALCVIDEPDASPDDWRPRILDAPPSAFDALPATAVVRDADHVVALAIRQEGTHAGALVRYAATALARGELDGAEWWAGDRRGWIRERELGTDGPSFVIDDAGAECSLHFDSDTQTFVHVATYGFGASTIGVRTAAAITGPWSAPVIVYRPPESDGVKPFVYAAKAHPELEGSARRELVVTYATNAFDFGDLFTADGERLRYWPRFVVVPLGE